MEFAAGTMVTSELRLVRPLSAGAMGSVWVAEHAALSRKVAVKFVSTKMARDRATLARFDREATAASKIRSPNVVKILEHDAVNGVPYLVMELLEGESLGARLSRDKRLPIALVAKVVHQIGSGLDAAHGCGILHRDIKPDNVFLVGRKDMPLVKLLDFGMAKPMQQSHDSIITATGVAVGTPEYMSPEQVLASKDVDFRSDLWALGVVAYRMMAGCVPFRGDTPHALFFAICNGDFVPLEQVGVPPELEPWFRKMLQPNKDQRFDSARNAVLAFEAALASAPPMLTDDAWGDDESTQLLQRDRLGESLAPLTSLLEDSDTVTKKGESVEEDVSPYEGVEVSPSGEPSDRLAVTTEIEDDMAPTHQLDARDAASAIAAALAAHGDPTAEPGVPTGGASTLALPSQIPLDALADLDGLRSDQEFSPQPEARAENNLSHSSAPPKTAPSEPPPLAAAVRALKEVSVAPEVPSPTDAGPRASSDVESKGPGKWLYAVAGLAALSGVGAFLMARFSGSGVSEEKAVATTVPIPTEQTPAPPEPQPVTTPEPSAAETSHSAKPEVSAAAQQVGTLSVMCTPACSDVRVGAQSFGPSPVFKREVPAGSHKLFFHRRGLTKMVHVDVPPGGDVLKRITMSGSSFAPTPRAEPPPLDDEPVPPPSSTKTEAVPVAPPTPPPAETTPKHEPATETVPTPGLQE